MERYGCRLCHGGLFERNTFGDGEEVTLGGDDILGKGTIPARAEVVVIQTLCVLALGASGALPTPKKREGGYDIAGSEPGGAIAAGFDRSGELVSADQREGISSLLEDAGDIGAADAAEGDAHQHLVGRGGRLRNRLDLEVADAVEEKGFHSRATRVDAVHVVSFRFSGEADGASKVRVLAC
jgi:hypothetical protein